MTLAGPAPTTRTSQCAWTASYPARVRTVRELALAGQASRHEAVEQLTVVAVSIGSGKGVSTCTSALGSSGGAASHAPGTAGFDVVCDL